MTMTTSVAAMRITSSLREAETALDQAMLKQAELMATMIKARLDADAEPFTGQAEIMRLLKAQQAITSSSNDLARVHGGMLEIGREKAVIDDCPEPGKMRPNGALAA